MLESEGTFEDWRSDERRACVEQKVPANARNVDLLDVKRVELRGSRAAEVTTEYAEDGERKVGKAFLRRIDDRWLVQFTAR